MRRCSIRSGRLFMAQSIGGRYKRRYCKHLTVRISIKRQVGLATSPLSPKPWSESSREDQHQRIVVYIV